MHSITARSLLLLMLLLTSMQSFAVPCALPPHDAPATSEETPCGHSDVDSDSGLDIAAGHHSGVTASTMSDMEGSTGSECGDNCGCCPAHCASILPASSHEPAISNGHSSVTRYNAFDPSPIPDLAIRPPIAA